MQFVVQHNLFNEVDVTLGPKTKKKIRKTIYYSVWAGVIVGSLVIIRRLDENYTEVTD